MQTLQGIAVSPGIAIGEALIITNEGFRIPRRFVTRDAVDDELKRLHAAFSAVATDIESQRQRVSSQLGDRYGAIFAAHSQLLADPKLSLDIETLIREKQFSPEFAVSRTLRGYAKVLQDFGGPYLSERADDLFEIERSLLQRLTGQPREELDHLATPVVVAHNLTPGETARLNRQMVLGFVTEAGGPGGHTAIVAKGLEIPAVVGTGRFLSEVSGGDLVIIDGDQGQVILQPDDETLASFRRDVETRRTVVRQLESLRDLPAETTDGTRILIHANIEFPAEAHLCVARGVDGIGLYRTEFLYLSSNVDPTEEEHYQAYLEVVTTMAGRPVIIRTLDLGADKMGRLQLSEEERNPFLGLRSIRISLRNPPGFRTQLRAILRASAKEKC